MNHTFKGLLMGLVIFGSIAFFMEDNPSKEGLENKPSGLAMISQKLQARNVHWQAQLD